MKAASKLDIRQLLILSTSHITKETARWLELAPWSVPGGAYADFGWFFYVVDERPIDFPDDLWRLFEFAAEHGCQHLLLDRDGHQENDLPQHDW